MPDGGIWSQYWRADRIASCFDGDGRSNYAACIGDGWRAFYAALPAGSRILDLCTGNGAAALFAAELSCREDRRFAIHAVDQAEIDPPAHVSRHRDAYAAIHFHGGTAAELLPFPTDAFDATISQYGVEYADLGRALPEAVRVLAPGGALRFVIHAIEGTVVAQSRPAILEADLLLDDIGLPAAAREGFAALAVVEREGDRGPAARDRADRAFTAFQEALRRTAEAISGAEDKAMFRNSGGVLYDSFSRRARLPQAALLAKVDAIEGEIGAHRGRLQSLVAAAHSAEAAAAMATLLKGLGAAEATAAPLHQGADLIGHVVEARFP